MDGFGSHTYQWVNAEGERFWVKYHFKTDQGIEFLTQDEAEVVFWGLCSQCQTGAQSGTGSAAALS